MSADILYYLLTGAAAGFAAGLLGIGGGLIIVPVLYLVFSRQNIDAAHIMHLALATSLASIVFTSISSTLAHHRRGAVLWPLVLLLSPGILLGAWLGGQFASSLDSELLRPVFGVFELLVAIHLLSRLKPAQHAITMRRIKAFIGGGVIGFVSAIVGIGGGTLTVPFLHWHNIGMRNAVATSAACGLPIALAATASFVVAGWGVQGLPRYTLGYVETVACASIVITSMLLAPIGARVAHSIPETSLRLVFGLLLLALSAKMLLG